MSEPMRIGPVSGRDYWLPSWEVTTRGVVGQRWPRVTVELWETNDIGERRLVAVSSVDPTELAKQAKDRTQ